MPTNREISRQNFEFRENNIYDVQLGCLQRIADATEKMAANYVKMENDLAMYKRWYDNEHELSLKKERSISALKGQITKLKNKNNK